MSVYKGIIARVQHKAPGELTLTLLARAGSGPRPVATVYGPPNYIEWSLRTVGLRCTPAAAAAIVALGEGRWRAELTFTREEPSNRNSKPSRKTDARRQLNRATLSALQS